MRCLTTWCYLAISVLALTLLGSCVVMSGTTFANVVASEGSEPASQIGTGQSGGPSADPSTPSVRIVTTPDDARVTLDATFVGRTPLDLYDLRPGRYRLLIEKSGYYPVERRIAVDGATSLRLEIDLERITGYLQVDVTPEDSTVRVDVDQIDDGFAELPIGDYQVRVERFGYLAASLSVRIEAEQLTRVELGLDPAPFTVERFAASSVRFNPGNPGVTGTTRLRWRVSGPGVGRVEVTDASGTVVRRLDPPRFTEWDQTIAWDGMGDDGRVVGDGVYSMTLYAVGDDGRESTETTSIRVDSSLVVAYRSVWGGTPGLIYSPALTPLPAGVVQLSAQVAGAAGPVGDRWVVRLPGRAGVRFGIGERLEAAVHAGAIAHSSSTGDRWSAGATIGWSPIRLVTAGGFSFRSGVTAGGVYQSPVDGLYAGPDTQASHPGLFVSFPIQLGLGPVLLVAAPEVRFSPAPVWYGGATRPDNAWGAFGYLRGGVLADFGPWSGGASVALRTTSFGGRLTIERPILAGAELHWLAPEHPLVLSAFVASEITGATDFYVMPGFGIGFLF